jgi:2-methylisocitrate lyase-like PEP mutase family enzyme
MFVNVRTDTFLLNVQDALVQTLYRGQLYANHGACGFFVPCVTRAEDITAIVRHVPLPLNVMCMPELADFSTLSTLGVKRISMGNFIHAATQARLKDLLCQVQTQHSFSGVF